MFARWPHDAMHVIPRGSHCLRLHLQTGVWVAVEDLQHAACERTGLADVIVRIRSPAACPVLAP